MHQHIGPRLAIAEDKRTSKDKDYHIDLMVDPNKSI